MNVDQEFQIQNNIYNKINKIETNFCTTKQVSCLSHSGAPIYIGIINR